MDSVVDGLQLGRYLRCLALLRVLATSRQLQRRECYSERAIAAHRIARSGGPHESYATSCRGARWRFEADRPE
jgi:hypothetical protein